MLDTTIFTEVPQEGQLWDSLKTNSISVKTQVCLSVSSASPKMQSLNRGPGLSQVPAIVTSFLLATFALFLPVLSAVAELGRPGLNEIFSPGSFHVPN